MLSWLPSHGVAYLIIQFEHVFISEESDYYTIFDVYSYMMDWINVRSIFAVKPYTLVKFCMITLVKFCMIALVKFCMICQVLHGG